jgi:phage regulator Rha-like protein
VCLFLEKKIAYTDFFLQNFLIKNNTIIKLKNYKLKVYNKLNPWVDHIFERSQKKTRILVDHFSMSEVIHFGILFFERFHLLRLW